MRTSRTLLPLLTLLTLLTVGLLASGCARTVREATYAPSFGYVERKDVKSTMWQLASGVTELNAVLRGDELLSETKQAEVLRVLDEIQDAASSLRGNAEATNHPLLDDHLGDFLADVRRAREAVSGEPPSYFFAGNVTGACMYCHAKK